MLIKCSTPGLGYKYSPSKAKLLFLCCCLIIHLLARSPISFWRRGGGRCVYLFKANNYKILLAHFLARQAEGSVLGCRKPQFVSLVIFFFFFFLLCCPWHDRICFTSLLPGSNPSGFVRSMVCNNCTHPRWLLKTLWNAICQACVQPAACHSGRRKEEAGSPPWPFSPWCHWMEPGHVGGLLRGKLGVNLLLACRVERFCLGNKPWRFYGWRLNHPAYLLPPQLWDHLSLFIYTGKMGSASYIFPLKCSIFEVLHYFEILSGN